MTESRVEPDGAGLPPEHAILAAGDEGTEEYLLTGWFYRAMETIRDVRIKNGLTQEAIAKALGTTQSVVARLENSHRGAFSLERFLRYAWACGAAPLDFQQVSPSRLAELAMHDPVAPRTTNADWMQTLSEALGVGRLTVAANITWEEGIGEPVTWTVSFENGAGRSFADSSLGNVPVEGQALSAAFLPVTDQGLLGSTAVNVGRAVGRARTPTDQRRRIPPDYARTTAA